MKKRIVLILGGDERSLRLGEYLETNGFSVCYFAFKDTDCFETVSDAISGASYIVLPLPVTRDRVNLNTPLYEEPLSLATILMSLERGKTVFGGQIPACFGEEMTARGVKWHDYFLLEELQVYNSVPTAEGAVQLLMENLPVTVHGMSVAVFGYGKVGKVLSSTLSALGAKVTVAARKERDFASCYVNGYEPLKISDFKDRRRNFDAVINTVPKTVLGLNELSQLNPDCLIMEIASAPFGIDFQAARELGFEVIKASSLPGKVAPKTAGEIIGKSILPILTEKGMIP